MCLESFDKGKVASAGGMEVVADKGDALCPMELPLGINSHDHLSCPTWIVGNGASNKGGHTVNRLHQPYLRSPYVTQGS